ncbi:MAG: 3'-5' exonuclease [Spirochaetes bacterium]|nr:3'-5' exonuclease [Spirochaetota bacterium]
MPKRNASVFVAIDFETADYGQDSACAVGLVRVERGVITAREYRMIRPPRDSFVFTYIHGITWADVANEPEFGEVWQACASIFDGAGFIAAHNASFDANVLAACCDRAGLPRTKLPFVCTVKLARIQWKIFPTKLPDVCRKLNISLNHHEALSDAEACARIVIAAMNDTVLPSEQNTPVSPPVP